jgi:hypothetical protein
MMGNKVTGGGGMVRDISSRYWRRHLSPEFKRYAKKRSVKLLRLQAKREVCDAR